MKVRISRVLMYAVIFASFFVIARVGVSADPSIIWTIEDGVRLQGGWPHCPDIVKLPDETYRMYHNDSSPYTGTYPVIIRSSVSSDGMTWTKEAGIRIGLGYGGEASWASGPETMVLQDGTYRMYYDAEKYPSDPPIWGRIFSAVSTDGLTWTKEPGTRIDCNGTYDSNYAVAPDIIQLPDETYRMYYAGYDGQHYRILSAVSADGLIWTKEEGIRIDIGGTYDSENATIPKVMQVPGGNYIMLYAGFNDVWSGYILSAVSTDGLIWTKEKGIRIEPNEVAGGPYSNVFPGEILVLPNGQYRMYFSADRYPPVFYGNRMRIFSAIGTICTEYPLMDFNQDCKVDFYDFALFVNDWLECNLNPPEACWE